MKILQVCSYLYPALTYGGPAKMVYDLSIELSLKHKVTIYTTDVWDQNRRILTSEKILSKKNFQVIYFKNIFNSLAFKIRFFTGFGMILDFLKNYKKYDLVHIHDVFILPQLLIGLCAIALKKPLFFTPHGVLDPVRMQKKTRIKQLLLPIALYCLQKSKQVIAVSQKEATDLRNFGLKNSTIIYNGVPKLIASQSKKFAALKNKQKITLLYIGKIHPQKGLKEVLIALHNSKLDAQFLIAGPDDGAKVELEEMIKNLGIKNIYFLGFVGDNEKKELYKMADLFVYPSYAEGFSISILEAMQEGLPVLISDGCNFPEVEIYQAGYVIQVEQLQKQLLKIFIIIKLEKNNLKKMGSNAYKLIERSYTVSLMTKKIQSVYEKYV